MTYINNTDPWIEHAKQVIFEEDGVNVTLEAKNKDLLKFGRNKLTNTSKSTIMHLPNGTDNETYISSNLITTISSSSGSDTVEVTVEGHTISGSDFTFVTQNITLTGQTQATLSTALARVSRVRNNSATDLVGDVYLYQNDTSSSGVPDTDSLVHLIVDAGLNNSEKAATTLSSTDYWAITGFYGDCLEKSSTFGIIHLEVRAPGMTFINIIDISASTNSPGEHSFIPYVIVKPNSDVRLRASASTANKDFSGGIQGSLLKV